MPAIDDDRLAALRRQIALRLVARSRPLSLRDLIDEEDVGRKALLEMDDIIIGKS